MPLHAVRLFQIAFLASALAWLSGCATVTRGTSETIVIQSIPSGATVRLSNGFTGVTPASFVVSRKGDIVAHISKEGYETQEVTLQSKISGKGSAGFVGNALIGGVIGMGVDVATGATLAHSPNPFTASLVELRKAAPVPAPAPATDPSLPTADTPAPVAAVLAPPPDSPANVIAPAAIPVSSTAPLGDEVASNDVTKT